MRCVHDAARACGNDATPPKTTTCLPLSFKFRLLLVKPGLLNEALVLSYALSFGFNLALLLQTQSMAQFGNVSWIEDYHYGHVSVVASRYSCSNINLYCNAVVRMPDLLRQASVRLARIVYSLLPDAVEFGFARTENAQVLAAEMMTPGGIAQQKQIKMKFVRNSVGSHENKL
jgi:hypothetical protein